MKKLVMLFLLLTVIGCGDDDPAAPTPTVFVNADCLAPGAGCDIIPLAVGNFWIHQRTTFDAAGNVTGTVDIQEIIERDTLIGEETWYLSNLSGLYTNRSDGLYIIASDVSPPRLLYKYPALVGDTFGDARVTAVEFVIVRGNTCFACVEYRSPGVLSDSVFVYVAPGIGIMRQDAYTVKDPVGMTAASNTVLLDYHLE